ncbi:MAG: radical SAM family heme chaperone HemW [Acidimicrobiales bacterium]
MALGVYLHVPFCRRRCDYCSFATWTDRDHLQSAYLDACRRHLAAEVERGVPPVTSVFVGGGTPSLVDAGALLDVLAEAPLADGAEVTIECNPDDLDEQLAARYARGGVTRLSIGVQSMQPEVLATLGREHRPENVERAVGAAQAAGLSVNIDLVYGAAGETLAGWESTVRAAIDLAPHHVSAYALTVEPGTPLAADPARHPDDDTQADEYQLATRLLGDAGYEWYEISNWAKPGHECRHNLLYWTGGEYLAIGCAAHGHRAGRRHWNVRTPERYLAAIVGGRSPEAGAEELDEEGRRLEGLQLAIRTRHGVDGDAVPEGLVDELDGLVVRRGDRVVLTPEGRLLANEVAIRLG